MTRRELSEQAWHLLLRQAMETAPEVVAIIDADGDFYAINRSVERILGWGPAELEGASVFEYVHPDDMAACRDALARAVSNPGVTELLTVRFRHMNGSWRHLEIPGTSFFDADGAVWIVAHARDVSDAIRAEQELRSSEDRYRAILESMGDAIHMVDSELRIVMLNGTFMDWCDQFEVAHPVLGTTVTESFPFLPSRVVDEYRQVFASAEPLVTQETLTLGAREVVTETRKVPVVRRGVVTHVLTIIRDMTDRVRAEQALRQSEARYRSLVERNLAGVFRSQMNGTLLDCNDAFAHILGFESREEVLKHPAWELYSTRGDRERFLAELRLAGELRNAEVMLRRADGEPVWVLENVSLLGDPDAPDAIIEGTLIDISDRRRSEERLRLQGAALKSTANAIVIADADGTIIWVNPAFTTLTGYEPNEVIGKHASLLSLGDHDPTPRSDLWQTIRAGKVWHGELRKYRKDGSEYWEEMTVTPVVDDDGVITNFVAIRQDITPRIEMEEQLRQSQKLEAVGRLAGGVAHDFNNLLQAMLGVTQGVLYGARGPAGDPSRSENREEVRDVAPEGRSRSQTTSRASGAADRASFAICSRDGVSGRTFGDAQQLQRRLEEIEGYIERGAQLTRQLLLFSRREKPLTELFDLNHLVRRSTQLLRRLMRENISLALELTSVPALVDADRNQLEQVVMNLAVNACDSMPEGGCITLRTGVDRQHVRLEVVDTGFGIPEEIRDRVFEPFFTTRDGGEGTGLGLSVVHGIITQHGGAVHLDTSLGVGTTVRVELPAAATTGPAATALEEPAALTPLSGSGERVLVVEDDPGVLAGMETMVRLAGYQVKAVSSAKEALRFEEGSDFALLITDFVLPDMSGTELARRLCERWPQLKVIVMSGYGDHDHIQREVSLGRVRYLAKPFTARTLAEAIHATLASCTKLTDQTTS